MSARKVEPNKRAINALERAMARNADLVDATFAAAVSEALDPRDPDPSREGMFRDHNCWKCGSGDRPCTVGNPSRCEYPHARND